MVAIKSGNVDRFLQSPDPGISMVLIYGPDRGLVAERANLLGGKILPQDADAFSLVKLDGEDVAADPGRLIDEALTISMFGDRRLIWVKNVGSKPLTSAIEPLVKAPAEGAFLLFEAGDLKPSSALRKKFEGCRHAAALPCYSDGLRDLDRLIDGHLDEFGLTIEQNAREALKSMLGSDRLASRGEILKLCLYCQDEKRIELQAVEEVVGDAGALNANAVVDAAFSGQIGTLETQYRRLIAGGTSGSSILSASLRHCQMLQGARLAVDRGKPAQTVIKTMRPPVYFARQSSVVNQISRWQVGKLDQILSNLNEGILAIRLNSGLERSLPHRELLWIARTAINLAK